MDAIKAAIDAIKNGNSDKYYPNVMWLEDSDFKQMPNRKDIEKNYNVERYGSTVKLIRK